MMRGYLGNEPIGLELIDGYNLKIMQLEWLGLNLSSPERCFDLHWSLT